MRRGKVRLRIVILTMRSFRVGRRIVILTMRRFNVNGSTRIQHEVLSHGHAMHRDIETVNLKAHVPAKLILLLQRSQTASNTSKADP